MQRIFALILFALVGFVTPPAAEDVATVSFAVNERATFPNTVKAGRTIEVDLSAIAKDAAIIRAVLRPGRDERLGDHERIKPVQLTLKGSDATLRLRPPRFRSFDVTEAVAGAVKSGAGKVAFDVVSLAGYQPKDTRLDVTATVKPKNDIPRVTGIKTRHNAGQTFVTWREVDPPVTAEDITFREWKAVRKKMQETPRQIRYRIYRSSRPIDANTIRDAELVDEVGPLTCWNTDYYGISPKDEDKLLRYAVEDRKPPVAPGTGIYVHNPQQAGRAYYAVSAAVNGEEDLTGFDGGNATDEPVRETVGQGIPVLQRVEKPQKPFHYVEGKTVLHYIVRWEAPPNCNLPSTPYDYLVAVPPKFKEPLPVGLHLHCWGGSLNGGYGWWYNAAQGAILVATNQIPYDWWTGYHENLNTWKSWSEGVVHDYSQQRILSFVKWLGTKRRLDPNRMFTAGSSMGGSGSPNFGIRHADRIAWVVSWVGVHDPRRSPQFKGSYEQVYGRCDWALPFQDGRTAAFDYFNDNWYLKQDPARDTPLICFSNGKNDGGIGWPQARDFWKALQDTRRPHVFIWGQGGHGQRALLPGPNPGERELGVDVRLNRTLPAFTNCSLDDNPGDGDPKDGDAEGQSNLYLYWDSDADAMVDEPDRWAMTLRLNKKSPKPECTVDVTPRRCQQFKARPGERFRWTNTPAGESTAVQSGEIAADRWGLVTVPRMEVRQDGNRLTIVRTRR